MLNDVDMQSLLDNEIIIGHVLARNLEVKKMDKIFVQPLQKKKSLNIVLPIKSLIVKGIFTSGLQEFDKTLAYTNLKTAQKIFEIDTEIISVLIVKNKLTDLTKRNINYPFVYETWKNNDQSSLSLEAQLQKKVMAGSNQMEAVKSSINRTSPNFTDPE